MSFVIQRPSGGGTALTQLRGELLRIGRGTNAELRSENPAVALEHAVIEPGAAGYTITDKGSITGTYVNGRPVESALLARGDVIEIGDLKLEVQVAESAKPLFLRLMSAPAAVAAAEVEEEEAPSITPGGGVVKAKKVDYVAAYRLRRPYVTKLSLVALLVIGALVFLSEVTKPPKRVAFMPGGVSSAHARARDANGESIANNCEACHDPWRGVADTRCTSCHTKAQHSMLQNTETPCTTCHMEHRATAKLALVRDSTCVACHGDLASHERTPADVARAHGQTPVVSLLASNPAVAHITSFGDDHPQFTFPGDADTLRFNHALHLKQGGIFNAAGKREELQCVQCHRMVEVKGKVDPKPVAFAQDCQRCHRLTFDARFPDVEVPHGGDPGLVYGFVLATYAGNRDIAGRSPEEVRRILTSRPQSAPGESAVLNAEGVIKAKCTLCHEMRRESGRLAATPPVIPTRWFERAKFSHTQHRDLSCESCHEARRSERTSDVLMPARSSCTSCHGPQTSLKSSSKCVTCHEYHGRFKVLGAKAPGGNPARKGGARPDVGGTSGMLGTILLWAVILLMLVVFLPAGIALYQRVKASTPAAPPPPPARPPAAKTPPAAPRKTAAPPPAAAAPVPSSPSQQPRPASPAAAPAEATQMIDLGQAPAPRADAPAATEMVQWYGMLTCTAGPLEGQRFVIDDEGLTIGRDSSLSKIVIVDERVSKRHLRIVPRSGKVWAVDQNSTNGTFLGKAGGQRITEVQLKRGDILVLADGAASFLYQI